MQSAWQATTGNEGLAGPGITLLRALPVRRQARLDVGNSLGVVPKEDGLQAELAGGGDARLGIVQEDGLGRLHAEALAGQGVEARLGLLHPLRTNVYQRSLSSLQPPRFPKRRPT